ncbi:MAG: hypothetical protein KF782_12635 [Labilithrix sp.]|nr:hypothetical protein [Labilithrix sp.]
MASASSGPEHEAAGAAPSTPEVLTRGTRVIVVERGTIMAQRPTGKATSVELAPAGRDKDAKRAATVARFLGQAELLDVTVVESSERGWQYDSRETHYVLDTSGPSDVLACTFAGKARSGGEYSSDTTSIAIKQTAQKPLAFDVTRTTTSRASQPQPAPPPKTATSVDHFELGASSCASAARP